VRISKKPEASTAKTFTTRHIVTELWFNTEPIDPADGWTKTPAKGRPIVAIRNCLMSDMSSVRWYRVVAPKAKKKISTREKRVRKNGKQQRQQA
jgi:hypothetical protein